MATKKTILLIEVDNKQYHASYSGKLEPDWSNLTPGERKEALRHDGRIMNALIECEPLFNRLREFVKCVEIYKRREAKKAAKNAQN